MTYTLYLNSIDLVNGNKTEGSFYVDWSTFLPNGKYKVSTYFKTFNEIDTEATETLFIYSSLVSSNNNFNTKTKGKSSLLAIAEPVNEYVPMTAGMTSYYSCKNSFPITVDYPPQNIITITIKDKNNAVYSTLSLENYVMVLTFESL